MAELIIGGNKFATLPDSMALLKRLVALRLGSYQPHGNPLGRLPKVVRGFSGLKSLWATSCCLSTVPDWLDELTQLTDVKLADNKINDLS